MEKTTRAFRTISEAGEELDLQPHVLRFWESKFPQIKPIKRGGGRRFYRPEDIEFLRGIKILLHNEKHPIKDVQKLIRTKGPQRIVELGQSVERAARDKDIVDTVLIPQRIANAEPPLRPVVDPRTDKKALESEAPSKKRGLPFTSVFKTGREDDSEFSDTIPDPRDIPEAQASETEAETSDAAHETTYETVYEVKEESVEVVDMSELEAALERLQQLRAKWDQFSITSE